MLCKVYAYLHAQKLLVQREREKERAKEICLIHTQKESGVKKPARQVSKDRHGFSPGNCGFYFFEDLYHLF